MLEDLDQPGMPNQKYFAHQIALIYVRSSACVMSLPLLTACGRQQCLAGLGPAAESYRGRIQAEFETLKRALEGADGVLLDPAQTHALAALVSDVAAAVRQLAPGLLRRAHPNVQHVLTVFSS
jgi:hypothetical protein